MQSLVGRTGFEDANTPVPGKSDWGMDTISRKMVGHISLLSDFIATLQQGDVYLWNGTPFYLQTWDPNEQSPVASVTLNYKGLINGTPAPDIRSEVQLATGSTSADYSDENFGAGRLYSHDIIATIGETIGGPGSFGTTAEFYRNRYATAATMEFTYRALTTTYRYVTIGPPKAATYAKVFGEFEPTIERVRIITSDGAVFGRSKMSSLGLTPVTVERVIDFTARQIFGSPYWECEDVVRKELTSAA